jgi:chemotaxis protein CheX
VSLEETDTEFVVGAEDLTAIVTDVWDAFLFEEGGEPPVLATPHARDEEIVHASVGVQGAWVGQIVLELTSASAIRAARTMLDADLVTTSDVFDAVGELVNIIGGNIKSLLPPPTTLGLPIVVQGRLAGSATHGAQELCALDLSWTGEPLRLTVWTADTHEEPKVNS